MAKSTAAGLVLDRRAIVALLILAVLHTASALARTPAHVDGVSPPPYPHAVGELHSDFAAPDQEGSSFRLSDQRGKVVLLHLCTVWCTACRESAVVEAALIRDVDAEVGADNWVLIDALTQRVSGAPSIQIDAQNWRQILGTPARTLHVNGDGDSDLYLLSQQVWAFPAYVVVGKDGAVTAIEFGFTPGTTPQLFAAHVFDAWNNGAFGDGFENASAQ